MKLGKLLVFTPTGKYKEISEIKEDDLNLYDLINDAVLKKLSILVKEAMFSKRRASYKVDETVDVESLTYLDNNQLTFKFNVLDETNPVGPTDTMFSAKIELYLSINELGMEICVMNVKTEGQVDKVVIPTTFIHDGFIKGVTDLIHYSRNVKFTFDEL